MDAQGVSTYALSQRSGLSERHLGDLVAGRVTRPRPATVRELASALDVPINRLVGETPGHLLFSVLLPEDLADTAYTLAAIRRSGVESLLEEQLREYLERCRRDPKVARVVEAMADARHHDEAEGDDVATNSAESASDSGTGNE